MKSKEEIEQLLTDMYGSSISTIGKELFVKGYTQCQEDMAEKKYTEDDIRNAFFSGGVMKDIDEFNHFINSLNKQD